MGLQRFFLNLSLLSLLSSLTKAEKPNVVFVMLDDVGWADLSYQHSHVHGSSEGGKAAISTPFIDKLATERGSHFHWHYTHSSCTPSRAAFITGRYSVNVGLPLAMLPGSPAGIPPNTPTLPQLLREQAGYEAHMVGKWHLGFLSWAQTPVGKGFQTHTGVYSWSNDYWSKEIYQDPWTPTGVDWIRSWESDQAGKFEHVHYGEVRHSTEAITAESIDVMRRHKEKFDSAEHPLFLYTAYTAAHAPLQPLDRHARKCEDIPHLWRRQYCGLVVGLDEGIQNLTSGIEEYLGENTVMVVSSDNGGSPWFGGLNYPLQGAKLTPFEGGCRVPAFAVDFTEAKQYIQPGPNKALIHISDWLPTFLAFAGVDVAELGMDLDGVDMSRALISGAKSIAEGDRKNMLYDLTVDDESVFAKKGTQGYRKGKWKLIKGHMQDTHRYFEPQQDRLNSTDSTPVALIGEWMLRAMEFFFGESQLDIVRTAITHAAVQVFYYQDDFKALYDLENDPEERSNVMEGNEDIVEELEAEMLTIQQHRPPQQEYWMILNILHGIDHMLAPGDCSANEKIRMSPCLFIHPTFDDESQFIDLDLVNGKHAVFYLIITKLLKRLMTYVVIIIAFFVALKWVRAFMRRGPKSPLKAD